MEHDFLSGMPNSEIGLAGWNVNATQFFVPSTEFFPEDVELQFWKASPLFPLETVFFHEASPVSGYLAALSVPLKERKDGTPFKWNTFFIDGHFTEISNFQFPKVAYHLLKVSGEKSRRKVNDTCLFGSFRKKISGSNGTHLIRWSCFSGWNLPNGN